MIYNFSKGPYFGNEVARADADKIEGFLKYGVVLFWKQPKTDVERFRMAAKTFGGQIPFAEFDMKKEGNLAVAKNYEMMIDGKIPNGWGAAAAVFKGGGLAGASTDVDGLLALLGVDEKVRLKGVIGAEEIDVGAVPDLIERSKRRVFVLIWGDSKNGFEKRREFIEFAERRRRFDCVLVENLPRQTVADFIHNQGADLCPAIMCFEGGVSLGKKEDLKKAELADFLKRNAPGGIRGAIGSFVSILSGK